MANSRPDIPKQPRRVHIGAWILAAFLAVGGAAALLSVFAPTFLAASGDAITDYFESRFGLGFLVYVGISILSTPVERSILFVVIFFVLVFIPFALPRLFALAARRSRHFAAVGGAHSLFAAAICIAAVWVFICVLFYFFRPIDTEYADIIWDNRRALMPAHVLTLAYAALWGLVSVVAVPIVGHAKSRRRTAVFLAAAITAGAASLVPHGERMLRASLLIFPEPAVRVLPTDNRDNLSGIHVDPRHDQVLVSGHGTMRLLAYDLAQPVAGPRLSDADVGGAQNFGLNPERGEAYAYNGPRGELVVIDTATLKEKASIGDVRLSIGDPIIAWDDAGHVVIASEGPHDLDGPVENAFVVVDLAIGEVVARHAEIMGESLYFDPHRRLFYGTYFRDRSDIVVYDITRQSFVRRVPMPTKRMTEIGPDPVTGDLLVAFPLRSKLVRLDPDSLEIVGEVPAMLGARKFAFDLDRGLLVVMSLLASVSVIDIESGQTLATYRLPQPWLRNMDLDIRRGMAYVTGRHGFYQVNYTARIPKAPRARTATSR